MKRLLNALLSVVFLMLASTTGAQFTTVINVPPDVAPSSIDSDTQLNLFDGGTIGLLFDAGSASGASANIEVNIRGGKVGDFFDANSGSTVNISGGLVATAFNANAGSTINISGGSVGGGFDADGGSTVNISGGAIGDQFNAANRSEVSISGGTFVGRFNASADSEISIVGSEFYLDGVAITGLTVDQARTVSERDVTLSGLLEDMSPFSFDLKSTPSLAEDFFSVNATVTVTLMGHTSTGDYNDNSIVDAADYVVWRNTLDQTGSSLAADGNGNNQIDAGDYIVWKTHFGQTLGSGTIASVAVPEPGALAMLVLAAIATVSCRCGRPRYSSIAMPTSSRPHHER